MRRSARLIKDYLALGKARLSLLVAGTAYAGFFMGSTEANSRRKYLNPTCNAEKKDFFSGRTRAAAKTTMGVWLTSMAAAGLNQWFEVPLDRLMRRTSSRPMVRGAIGTKGALFFVTATGTAGAILLANASETITPTLLALINIGIYVGIYTPMKLISVHSTAVGAVVGAIPPIIGYISGYYSMNYTDHIQSPDSKQQHKSSTIFMMFGKTIQSIQDNIVPIVESIGLGSILYCWQFPHFNALSWRLREDYNRAGFRIAAVISHKKLFNGALIHSIILIPLTLLLTLDLVHPHRRKEPEISPHPYDHRSVHFIRKLQVNTNMITNGLSLASNIILSILALQFKVNPNGKTSRRLFLYTLVHLPFLLSSVVVSKIGRQKFSPKMVNSDFQHVATPVPMEI